VALQQYFSHPRYSYLLPHRRPYKWNWDFKRWETPNSNPSEPIKPSSQSTGGARLCCSFCQPQRPVQKCWAKTILLSPTSKFWHFFINNLLYSAPVELL
jgi:hypothetical protein